MPSIDVPLTRRGFGQTVRPDSWWVVPLLTFLGLGSFVVYVTWAAHSGTHYHFGNYLSPFYSPELWGTSKHAWFGPPPLWWPSIIPFSPALLILWAPGGFRFTCYYYRGAYYKAFWADPPSCSVGEPRKSYCGESAFPLILQNIHRYFCLVALFFLPILGYDVWKAMWFDNGAGVEQFGIGLGTIILAANTALLACYVLGCHSFRHAIGGGVDKLSANATRKKCYDGVSCLNRSHMRYAWASLVSVALSDVYIRLCSMGIWSDWRIL
ncbi:MAG: succinate dehydrogenase [Acidobacteria bacterium]|nr:succinate dehydrogenase [Acidobacteriota bacterium]